MELFLFIPELDLSEYQKVAMVDTQCTDCGSHLKFELAMTNDDAMANEEAELAMATFLQKKGRQMKNLVLEVKNEHPATEEKNQMEDDSSSDRFQQNQANSVALLGATPIFRTNILLWNISSSWFQKIFLIHYLRRTGPHFHFIVSSEIWLPAMLMLKGVPDSYGMGD